MKTNINKLKGKMAENGYNQTDLAEKLNVNRATIYRKFECDGLSFTIGEAHKIADILNLTQEEAVEIFLAS